MRHIVNQTAELTLASGQDGYSLRDLGHEETLYEPSSALKPRHIAVNDPQTLKTLVSHMSAFNNSITILQPT